LSAFDEDLPPLDCHAHIAPDVTADQVSGLGGAIIFAVTRSLAEASYAVAHGDPGLIWGAGVHPGDPDALKTFSADGFAEIVKSVGLVGEVGLHRRGLDLIRQREVFGDILRACSGEPVLLSIHSAGATTEIVELVGRQPHPGAILHWFLGDAAAIERATSLGCYFSASGAIPDDRLALYPQDRLLPETDFPAGGRGAGRQPGDTTSLEERLAAIWMTSAIEVRHRLYRNLKAIALDSGAIERLPERLQDFLLMA
jgi:TatD DNase family protein